MTSSDRRDQARKELREQRERLLRSVPEDLRVELENQEEVDIPPFLRRKDDC